MTSLDWDAARRLAASWPPGRVRAVPLREAVGAVTAEDVRAIDPVPHYDSSAMDGWAVAGAPPWRVADRVGADAAVEVVTGGAVPSAAEAVVPLERGAVVDGVLDAEPPAPGAHIRRAGEEAAAGAVLVAAGTRLSPAHVAVLGIAGVDEVPVRPRPTVALVLTGDEVVPVGRPAPGRVRDAFDPMLPLSIERLGARVVRLQRVGDDTAAIAAAITGPEDLVITVGGTGRSRVDRLRSALGDAERVFDGVAMRPGHPTVLARLPRPLLGLPGNPLAAVAALLSFLPPVLDGLTGATSSPLPTTAAGVDLPGWPGGTSLLPCAAGPAGLVPASAVRPNMLRGLAASAALAVVPPAGAPAGTRVRVLRLPW